MWDLNSEPNQLSVEVEFVTDVTRGSFFSPLVNFASQRPPGTGVEKMPHVI
jgi:hypothetical protein